MLDTIWACAREALPPHVRSVLGPKKNLLLLHELLDAARCPDKSLIDDVTLGFPYVGELPRSGSLPECTYEESAQTRETLRRQAAARSDEMSDVSLTKGGYGFVFPPFGCFPPLVFCSFRFLGFSQFSKYGIRPHATTCVVL